VTALVSGPRYSPRGLGVFLASGDVASSPMERAKIADRIAEARMRWAAIWIEAPDGPPRKPTLDLVQAWGEVLRAHGVRPWVWTFPRPDRALEAASWAGACLSRAKADGVILDVERPPKALALPDWTAEQARALVTGTVNAIGERTGIGVTSYPGRHGHGLPWDELVAGVGMPQIYSTADKPDQARAAMRRWQAAHGKVVPLVSVRSPESSVHVDPERLCARLSACVVDRELGCLRADGAAIWCWAMLSGKHRARLRDWAASVGW
jgi:hypothetical protein